MAEFEKLLKLKEELKNNISEAEGFASSYLQEDETIEDFITDGLDSDDYNLGYEISKINISKELIFIIDKLINE